jgi:hypothetical protein
MTDGRVNLVRRAAVRNIDVVAKRTAIKRVFLHVASLVVILDTALSAQTITGSWQGTLPIAESPRIVLKIAKANDGSLSGVFYRIDWGANGIPLSLVTFMAPDLNVGVAVIDTTYKGKLSADGRSLKGIWVQDKQSYPLTLVLATPDTLWEHDSAAPLAPMSATADPAFEVATIKPSLPDAKQRSHSRESRHFIAKNMTVADLISLAYQVRPRQVEGGLSWIDELLCGPPHKISSVAVEVVLRNR